MFCKSVNRNNGEPLNENTAVGYMKRFEAVINAAIENKLQRAAVNLFDKL
ncbi:MAG: phage integrase SAM-like domain-containing protein [Prevotellaceae bacterium]|jgi:hypothetical protein|nr:phage integrase SAM-like domain-containing protein [Prevotellaceae bacterium]